MAADGMAGWYRWLSRGLAEHLGSRTLARTAISNAVAPALQSRYHVLRTAHPHLPDPTDNPRAVALLTRALYVSPGCRKADWVLDALGGPPKDSSERRIGRRLLAPIPRRDRWIEVATHLGEVLVALTRRLPDSGLERTNAVLGAICFDAGARYGVQARDRWQLPQGPASAIEVLRMSEYVFRVNPEHWSTADEDGNCGSIEGNACPWYMRPGWGDMHCGIFGQFQSGVSSAFGLRYKLTKTIPRHGGDTCKIDLTPIGSRRAALAASEG
jgi:hypothetical protein